MSHRSAKLHIIALLALVFASVSAQAGQSAPEVLKVEPPNWWANHSINPVRLLVRGKNLTDATVETTDAGLRLSNVKVNAAGSYLFVDVTIDANAATGVRNLTVKTPGGSADFRFEITAALSREGRFQGFSPDDVIYLIMPDRFADGDAANNDPAESRGMYSRDNPRAYHGGDLQGIINRLPYLKDLGVTAIWMTPIYDNSGRAKDFSYGKNVTDYHGYGAIDFYRVEEHLGTLEKFKELVDKAHAIGMKVIQDQVANHTGPDHPWAADSPTPTWYNGTVASHLDNVFDIKSTTQENPDPARLEATLKGWFANILPDLNQDDPECARYIIQNAVWWVSVSGIDGIRQDTLPYAPRRFWSPWNQALKTEFPNLTVVGEVFDGRPDVVAFFQGGRSRFDGIDSHLHTAFDFPTYFAMRDVFIRNQPMNRLADVLNQDAIYPNARVLVPFLSNHDVKRFMSEEGASISKLKMAFAFLLTMRGTPQFYYGDEIGLKGGDDPDNRRDFPGGFPGDDHNAFTNAGRIGKERKVFKYVRSLLRMRAEHQALRSGDTKVIQVTDNALAVMRQAGKDCIIAAFNNTDKKTAFEIPVPEASPRASWVGIMSEAGEWRGRVTNAKIRFSLNPREAIVLEQKNR